MTYTAGVAMKEGTTYPQEHLNWHRCLVRFMLLNLLFST